jgi:hypothetical protein
LSGIVDVDMEMTSSPKIVHKEHDPAAEVVRNPLTTSTLKPTPALFSQKPEALFSQKPEASMISTSSSKSNDVDEATALSAAWSRMYPDGVLRPRFNPTDLKKLCPDFSSNPVLYKCYCSYKVYKKSLNQRALTLEAFE